jgi:uncharacterized protein (TIGR00106 family)
MEISIFPSGKEGASLGDNVVEILKIAEEYGVNYEITAMGTNIEGDLDTLFRIAREMHEVCFSLGYPRVLTSIKLDDRRDKDLSLKYKVESVKEKLAKQALHIRES